MIIGSTGNKRSEIKPIKYGDIYAYRLNYKRWYVIYFTEKAYFSEDTVSENYYHSGEYITVYLNEKKTFYSNSPNIIIKEFSYYSDRKPDFNKTDDMFNTLQEWKYELYYNENEDLEIFIPIEKNIKVREIIFYNEWGTSHDIIIKAQLNGAGFSHGKFDKAYEILINDNLNSGIYYIPKNVEERRQAYIPLLKNTYIYIKITHSFLGSANSYTSLKIIGGEY